MEEESVQRKFPGQHMGTELYNSVFLEAKGYGLFISSSPAPTQLILYKTPSKCLLN